jgi:FkbM family methyltransferase
MLISYAQNQEDVVLHRLTKFVDKGTFVDVGAAHPVIDNVTYSLYLSGWRGINVEPMSTEAEMLRSTRPLDTTHQIAVGSTEGSAVIHTGPSENRGASTLRADVAERYRTEGQVFLTETVQMVRLDTLIESEGIKELHLLKIDVEGLEKDVLEGANLMSVRPWVLVIESTRPNSTEDSSHEWESMVLDCGYVMTLFDGLNKFYVREDLSGIREALSVPANVFDKWVNWRQVQLQESLEAVVRDAEDHAKVLEESLAEAGTYAASLVDKVQLVERYANHLEFLLNKSSGWLPDRSRESSGSVDLAPMSSPVE